MNRNILELINNRQQWTSLCGLTC